MAEPTPEQLAREKTNLEYIVQLACRCDTETKDCAACRAWAEVHLLYSDRAALEKVKALLAQLEQESLHRRANQIRKDVVDHRSHGGYMPHFRAVSMAAQEVREAIRAAIAESKGAP